MTVWTKHVPSLIAKKELGGLMVRKGLGRMSAGGKAEEVDRTQIVWELGFYSQVRQDAIGGF